ncbi:hypothetical protein M4S82_15655 [Planococcus sp. MERTA32b]|nr:hypothetical protein [Planococcus sp. MER TA 32b]
MNNYQNNNRIFDASTTQYSDFSHPVAVNNLTPTWRNYDQSHTMEQPSLSQILEDKIWFKPHAYSTRTIDITVGENTHQVCVYVEEAAKDELVMNSLTNDCSYKTSAGYYMYCILEDDLRFRSKGEVAIYFALKETGLLFHANSRAIAGSHRKEIDFSVIHKGRMYILDVLSNDTHNSEKDAKNARFYQDYGVPMRSYTWQECINDPQGVVNDFLQWIWYGN